MRFAYNALGQLTTDYQEHHGPVNTTVFPYTLTIGYNYANGSANTVRRTGYTYTNSRAINYSYASGDDDSLSRVTEILDGTTPILNPYLYFGTNFIFKADLVTPQVRFTLASIVTGDRYARLDNFDRPLQWSWFLIGSSSTYPEQLAYTYDRLSNRLTRDHSGTTPSTTTQAEGYTYDQLYRVVDIQRGTLSGGSITSKNFEQNWQTGTPAVTGLDAVGNWANFRQDNNGMGYTLTQTRTHNAANEITGISGGSWASVGYDSVGNTTSAPQPAALGSSYTLVYDAWNRLVQVKSGGSALATYSFDGLNRRITKTYTFAGSATIRNYYYSDQWQILEERLQGVGRPLNDPVQQFIWGLRYVDDLIQRDRDTNYDGTLDEHLYSLQDGNFNVTALVDSTGSAVERYRYDAYGVPTVLNADYSVRSGGTSYQWETLFGGYYWDSTTGIYQVRFREYHAPLGRWLQRDRFGYVGSWNLYEYGASNPTTLLDVFGADVDAQDELKEAGISLACGRTAHLVIGGIVQAFATGKYTPFIDKAIVTILGSLKIPLKEGCNSLRRPDIVLIKNDSGPVYEIKPDTLMGRARGPTQLGDYIELLNKCCLSTFKGTCKDAGTSSTAGIPTQCGYLTWGCEDGMIYYKFSGVNSPPLPPLQPDVLRQPNTQPEWRSREPKDDFPWEDIGRAAAAAFGIGAAAAGAGAMRSARSGAFRLPAPPVRGVGT